MIGYQNSKEHIHVIRLLIILIVVGLCPLFSKPALTFFETRFDFFFETRNYLGSNPPGVTLCRICVSWTVEHLI